MRQQLKRHVATAEGDAPLAAAFDAAEEAAAAGAGDAPAEEALQLPLRLLRHSKRLQKRLLLPSAAAAILQQMNRLQLLSPLPEATAEAAAAEAPAEEAAAEAAARCRACGCCSLPRLPLQPDLHHSMPLLLLLLPLCLQQRHRLRLLLPLLLLLLAAASLGAPEAVAAVAAAIPGAVLEGVPAAIREEAAEVPTSAGVAPEAAASAAFNAESMQCPT